MDKIRLCINGITENSEIRGPVRYIFELARHLDITRYDVFLIAGEWQREVYRPLEDRLTVHYVLIGRSKASRAAFYFFSMPGLLRRLRIDVHHIPDTNPLPMLRSGAPIVSTIHDSAEFVVPYRFSWYQAFYRRLISRIQAHGSDAIVTVSVSSQRDLVKYLNISSDKITVTPLGVTPLFEHQVTAESKDSEAATPYILYVGVLEHAKNVDRLVEAYASLPIELQTDFRLYLVGRKGNAFPAICKVIQKRGISRQIEIFGYVSEVELQRLYQGAAVFAYLSEYEGFGLPILEAMRYGIPVLTSNRASLPEVAGDAALLTETDTMSIARALEVMLRNPDLRLNLAASGLERAASFHWEDTARKTEQVYESVLLAMRSGPNP